MDNNFFSDSLRVIGADLDLRGIKTFAIKCETDRFVIDAGYQSPPAAMPVTLHYTQDDIEELACKEREQIDYATVMKSLTYLSEILSAVATYVGDKEGRLLSLTNNTTTDTLPVVDIEYETVQRDRVFERLTGPAIHSLCVRDHKRRARNQELNDNRFTRFSSLPESA